MGLRNWWRRRQLRKQDKDERGRPYVQIFDEPIKISGLSDRIKDSNHWLTRPIDTTSTSTLTVENLERLMNEVDEHRPRAFVNLGSIPSSTLDSLEAMGFRVIKDQYVPHHEVFVIPDPTVFDHIPFDPENEWPWLDNEQTIRDTLAPPDDPSLCYLCRKSPAAVEMGPISLCSGCARSIFKEVES